MANRRNNNKVDDILLLTNENLILNNEDLKDKLDTLTTEVTNSNLALYDTQATLEEQIIQTDRLDDIIIEIQNSNISINNDLTNIYNVNSNIDTNISNIDSKIKNSNDQDIEKGDAINVMLYAKHTSTHITDDGVLKIDGGHNLKVVDEQLQSTNNTLSSIETDTDNIQSDVYKITDYFYSNLVNGATLNIGQTYTHVIQMDEKKYIDITANYNDSTSNMVINVYYTNDAIDLYYIDDISPWKQSGNFSHYIGSYLTSYKYVLLRYTGDKAEPFRLSVSKKF